MLYCLYYCCGLLARVKGLGWLDQVRLYFKPWNSFCGVTGVLQGISGFRTWRLPELQAPLSWIGFKVYRVQGLGPQIRIVAFLGHVLGGFVLLETEG